jgi:hypothetical protein
MPTVIPKGHPSTVFTSTTMGLGNKLRSQPEPVVVNNLSNNMSMTLPNVPSGV